MQAATINKIYAIRNHQEAILRARELLQVEGQEEEYYAWHKRTIESNKAAIREIKEAPETSWN